ncbi:MAG: NACHT domain-containing protein, partial [Crocosphaera sp.]
MNDISIIGCKPVSVWNKPLKVNFKDLFKSLGKAFIDGIMGNWGGVGKDVVDASVALNIQTNTIEEAAWLLIYRSVSHAMFDLISDSRELLILKDNENENNQDQKLDKILNKLNFEKDLEEYELEIKGNFFSYPQQLSILAPLEKIFSTYLKNFLEDDIQAEIIASRLPIYFVDALAEEWRRNLPKYEVLENQLSTPFDKAKAREFEWYQYRIRLQKKVEEPMFSEAFGLSKVYIPLRAYYWRKTNQFSEDELETITRERREKEKEAVVIDLEKELNDWLNQADQYDAMRIISGGPGSGKSSFVKMFAANLAANGNLRTLFIPLHLFDPKDDLINAVQTFIKGDELLNTNPLSLDELNEQKLLIIFDGLDELASQGEIAKEIAQKFIEEVQNKTNQLNRNRLLLQVIISGRELIIQDNSSKFRKEKQILNLLPYFVTNEEKRNKTFVDDDNLLEQDQRQDWWLKYSRVSGYKFKSLPSELDQGKLIEITSQPLLNYLVALSYVGGRIEFSKDSSLNIIYEDLLRAVYKRGWEKSQIYKPIKD